MVDDKAATFRLAYLQVVGSFLTTRQEGTECLALSIFSGQLAASPVVVGERAGMSRHRPRKGVVRAAGERYSPRRGPGGGGVRAERSLPDPPGPNRRGLSAG